MRKAVVLMTVLVGLGECTAAEQGAVIGGAGGAAIGSAVAAPGLRTQGALIGGAIGAVSGALIGRASERGQCYYRDQYGRRIVAECPRGY